MAIQELGTRLVQGNTGSAQAYTFDPSAGAHLQHVLRNLYKKPELAVVREHVCNAIDAHTVAEKPITDIVVTAPTWMDPTFRVRDFGGGLAPDQIGRLFSFGASDKGQRADLIGTFGLGCKVCLAASNTAHYVNRHAGRRTTYMVFLDENDCGQRTITEEDIPDLSGDGLEFFILAGHTGRYTEALDTMLQWRPEQARPRVIGHEVPPRPATALRGVLPDDLGMWEWTTDSQDGPNYYAAVTVLMAGVSYRLDVTPKEYGSKKFWNSLVLTMPIGAFPLTPSREEIQLTPRAQERASLLFDFFRSDEFTAQVLSQDLGLWERIVANEQHLPGHEAPVDHDFGCEVLGTLSYKHQRRRGSRLTLTTESNLGYVPGTSEHRIIWGDFKALQEFCRSDKSFKLLAHRLDLGMTGGGPTVRILDRLPEPVLPSVTKIDEITPELLDPKPRNEEEQKLFPVKAKPVRYRYNDPKPKAPAVSSAKLLVATNSGWVRATEKPEHPVFRLTKLKWVKDMSPHGIVRLAQDLGYEKPLIGARDTQWNDAYEELRPRHLLTRKVSWKDLVTRRVHMQADSTFRKGLVEPALTADEYRAMVRVSDSDDPVDVAMAFEIPIGDDKNKIAVDLWFAMYKKDRLGWWQRLLPVMRKAMGKDLEDVLSRMTGGYSVGIALLKEMENEVGK